MRIIIFLCFLIIVSCNGTTSTSMEISLDDYSQVHVTGDRISVILLKSFKNEEPCNQNTNANVYMCLDIETSDTILLFEPCKKMPEFAYNDYDGERDLSIERKDILNNYSDKLILSADSKSIKKRYKYIVGSLTYLIY